VFQCDRMPPENAQTDHDAVLENYSYCDLKYLHLAFRADIRGVMTTGNLYFMIKPPFNSDREHIYYNISHTLSYLSNNYLSFLNASSHKNQQILSFQQKMQIGFLA
jgi:hypothetical protein